MSVDDRYNMLSRVVATHIDIDAPPERVWGVLIDLPRWTEWNPFIPSVEGVLEVGRKLRVRVVPPGGKPRVFPPEVWVVRPCEEILWGGGFLGIFFRGDHSFLLEQLPEGETRFRQRERFRGLPVLFMRRLFPAIEQGYHEMNTALKQRVEADVLADELKGLKHRLPGRVIAPSKSWGAWHVTY